MANPDAADPGTAPDARGGTSRAPLAEPSPPTPWRDAWRAWRDRRLTDPRFRRWAARFAPTRAIARRRAAEVFDLVAGFVYSQVLFALVRLDAFAVLAEGPIETARLATRLGLEPAATERLVAAAVALRLVERRGGGRVGLGALGAPLVGNPGLTAMVEHHALLYADLADPIAVLRACRADRLAAYWPYATDAEPAQAEPARVAAYSALMSASQPLVADEVLAAIDVRRFRCLLDVGGGQGTFAIEALRRAPALRAIVFDLPSVAARAEAALARAGVAGRARTVGGSFLDDALPAGADLATLVRVLHDHDDARVAAVLAAVHRALAPGGTLVVAEPMAGVAGAEAMGDAYFGFYLLAMGRGRPRTAAQTTALLEAAGFVDVRSRATSLPLQTGVLVARKSGKPGARRPSSRIDTTDSKPKMTP